jgi:glyoxylase-like metal-dependent hydrolase (beta-lactamase superfamily II)
VASAAAISEVADGVAFVPDSSNVYVLRNGREAVCVDFGTGLVLDRLDELGVDRITDVLVTHFHRDGVQGLARAVEAGARVWVPPAERDLFSRAGELWLQRRVANDYDLHQDRFSLLEAVQIAGTVDEYRTRSYGGVDVYTLPTPGHTPGSVTYLAEAGGRKLAFSGDLVYGDGRVWSLAATQWSYSGVEGQAATIISAGILARERADLLLPAHGPPVADPEEALARVRARLRELMELRRGELPPWDLEGWLDEPWVAITPHLLRNRTSIATSYALLSDDGAALLVDWGYDLWTGAPLGNERSAHRPLLWSAQALRRDHGVERIEALVVTHYHDDHVAGANLLREVEGTEVWAPANVAPVLERPELYDIPCLWFDPIAVDRTLEPGEPVSWHEYDVTTYPLPGHTLYAAAIAFEADGQRVLATGDQQAVSGGVDGPDVLNYQYRNRFRIDDFVDSAELYRSLRPDLIVSGHSPPRPVTDTYLERMLEDGRRVAALHRELLPLDDVDFGAEGFGARIVPYRSTLAPRGQTTLTVELLNPFGHAATVEARLVVPRGWEASPAAQQVALEPHGEGRASFEVRAPAEAVLRAVVAVDITIDSRPFGQHAEALVSVA